MKQHLLKSFALIATFFTTLTLSAATYCAAPITSVNGAHTAYVTCSSLGGNQYQFIFESADAFKSYNSGSNFFMNVNGAGGYHVSKNLTQDGNKLSVIIESNVAPTIYVGDFFVLYEDGEAQFKIPTDADFSQVCENSDTPDTPDTPDNPDNPDTPDSGEVQTGACSGASTGVDQFYTENASDFAITSLEKGFTWKAETTTSGVTITVQFLDDLPGMAAPYLFTFDAQGVLIGDPIQMSGWNANTRTATHTLTGLTIGSNLVFLVQVALAEGKILYTERTSYVVGDNCEDTALEQPTITTTVRKVIENGQLIIIRGGVSYDLMGRIVR